MSALELNSVPDRDEEMERQQEKVDRILDWQEAGRAPDHFDDSFVIDMDERLVTDPLTEDQEAALDRIIRGFRIEE